MEFPARAEINLRVIDGFSILYWRVYCIPPQRFHQATSGAPTLDLLKEIELAALSLRNLGCFTHTFSDGTGLWVFSNDPNFATLDSVTTPSGGGPRSVITVEKVTLYSIFVGTIPLAEITQRLISEPQGNLLSSSDLQKQIDDNRIYASLHPALTYSTVYKAFVSSIAGLISLRAAERHGAIPLGKRTLFLAVDQQAYSVKRENHSFMTACPALFSTVDVDISHKGNINVSWRTVTQEGLQQLCTDWTLPGEMNLRSHEDVWLAPTGAIGRYIAMDKSAPEFESTETSKLAGRNMGATAEVRPISQSAWKLAVSTWLKRFGLHLDHLDGTKWVEIEILYPLYTRSIGVANEENGDKALDNVHTILWPAKFCFKRGTAHTACPIKGVEYLFPEIKSPLQFAEEWFNDATSRNEILAANKADETCHAAKKSPSGPSASPERTDIPQTIDSLARTIALPDLQPSTVYPTPPGGPQAQNPGTSVSDNAGTGGEYGLNYQIPTETPSGNADNQQAGLQEEPELLLSGMDVTTPGLGVGTGMYDAGHDNDLFGEMDEHFDNKGITEDDFNFFDEPGLADLSLDIHTHNQDHDMGLQDNLGFAGESLDVTKDEPESEPESLLPPEMSSVTGDSINKIDTAQMSVDAGDELAKEDEDNKDNGKQPMSPPLSPLRIKRMLFSDGSVKQNTFYPEFSGRNRTIDTRQEQGGYGSISFQRDMGFSDKKYGQDGRFWFHLNGGREESHRKSGSAATTSATIPTVGVPGWQPKLSKQRTHDYNTNDINRAVDSDQLSTSDLSEISDDSGSTDMNLSGNEEPGHHTNVKRKRNAVDAGLSTPSSSEKPSLDAETPINLSNRDDDALLASFLHQSTDWSLAEYFTMVRSGMDPVLCKREEVIQVAQLMVDQITQSSLDHMVGRLSESTDDDDIFLPGVIDELESLGQTHKFDLRTYTSPDSAINTPSQSKDAMASTKPNNLGSISKLNPPFVQIRRGNSCMDVLPPAISFWETFGLEPLKGQKDVIPYCLYPLNMEEGAGAFLDRLGLTYSSANLGKHSRPSNTKGLFSWSLNPEQQDYTSIMHKLQQACEDLGSVLSNLTPSNQNIVVYIVNPFPYGVALADICAAFLRLFHTYIANCDKHASGQVNELVLQIIPVGFVASSTSLVVPAQADFLRLALEVYSRCPPKDRTWDLLGCAPPLTLAEPTPKVVHFKLTPEGEPPLERGQCFHVAYSVSLDQRWVVAAWTDNFGRHQLTLTYCLREKDSNICRPMSDIRGDIWDTTMDIIGMSNSHWRLIIVKNEPIDPDEVEAWTALACQHNRTQPAKVELSILAVNTRPGLHLKTPPPPFQLNSFSQQPSALTPATTPKLNVPSPDVSTSAPTPPTVSNYTTSTPPFPPTEQSQSQASQPTDPNADTVLVDKSDETWAVTLPHRLNNSHSLGIYRPAIASGYLIRRRGTSDTDGLASLTVNLISTQSRMPPDVLLKEVLRMYRDLATLGRTRGIIHSQGNQSLPWHIATAARGLEILSYIL